MTLVYNTQKEKLKRRILRRKGTPSEAIVWKTLRDRRFNGYKFRRQYSVGKLVLDFYCPEAKLAVEIDGGSHLSEGSKEYDKIREEFVESCGITFLRFSNSEIYADIDKVLHKIQNTLSLLISPLLAKERGRG
ncbi:MAG: endonuclease domain-containing protein [Candidatus Spechtbacterales bacterium]